MRSEIISVRLDPHLSSIPHPNMSTPFLQNITSSPAPARAPIIPSLPSSRPPSLPPPLLALLSFSHARKTSKVFSAETMHTPPALPPRAVDPNGEEARLLGPFSLRRTVNIHKRFVRAEVGRTVPPLELRLKSPSAASPSTCAEVKEGGATRPDSDSRIELMLSGTPPVGLEGTRVFEKLEELAKAPPRPIPRRARVRASERASSSQRADISALALIESTSSSGTDSSSPLSSQFQSRFMRRRFAEILAQTPILARPSAIPISSSISPPPLLGKNKTSKPRKNHSNAQGGWTASLSPLALTKSATLGQAASARVSASDLAWIERSKEPAAAPPSRGGDKCSNSVGPDSDTR